MKILILVDKFTGGAGNIAQLMSIELSKRGYVVTLGLMDHLAKLSESRYPLHGVELVYMAPSSDKNRFSLFIHLIRERIKLFNDTKPDIIISFLTRNNVISSFAAKYCHIPIIVSERSNPLALREPFPWYILQRLSYKYANIIAVQFECFKGFLKSIEMNKYRCLPNVVVHNEHYKRIYKRDSAVLRLVAVGSLRHVKNYNGMIDIIHLARETGMELQLDIYGSGPQINEINAKIRSYNLQNIVILKGNVKEIHKILPNYDVYVMTSHHEGFPNALCEAMSSGLPCVAYMCHDGFKELIQDGYNGYLVTSEDKHSFVRRLEELFDSALREYIGTNAREISNRYSVDKVAGIWINSIEELNV